MSEVTTPTDVTIGERLRSLPEGARGVARTADVDTRLVGLLIALVVIWVGFNVASGGTFLTARNLWNLSVQSASIAIMATGMVLVIVSRNIDLSVGSMLGFIGYTMAMAMTVWLPETLGIGPGPPRDLDHRRRARARARPRRRRHPGLRHRLRQHPVIHRHARRPARLPRTHLPVRPGPDHCAPRHDLSGCSEAGRRARWASGDRGPSASSPSRSSSWASSSCGVARRSTDSRCGRCGPPWPSVSSRSS